MPIYPSASGYTGMEATPLARVGYSDVILSKIYEEDFLPRITSSELLEPVMECNQVIQIMRAPEVGPMRSYQKNQQLVPNTVTTEARCLQHVCHGRNSVLRYSYLPEPSSISCHNCLRQDPEYK